MVAEIFHSSSAPPTRADADRATRLAASRQAALFDTGLVRRFNAGDETAFVEIVTRYRGKMFHTALGLLRNRADAEEVSSDTFIRAHRGLGRFRGDSSLAAWLCCITLNLARNRYWHSYRRRSHAMLPLDAALSESGPATFAELVASNAPGPVREVANREFATIISDCMNRLTSGHREILTLRNERQHSYDYIARTLNIGIGTVKSRIARARSQLRLLLNQTYPEFSTDISPLECFEPHRPSGYLEATCA